MEEYFFAENDEQKGPFSLVELKEHKISRTTLVWKEGLNDWIEAGNLKELEVLFKSPPPLQKREKRQNLTESKTLNVNLGIKKREAKPKSIEDKATIQKRKTTIAKNLKFAGKIALISLLIGLSSSFLFFSINDGFEYISLKSKFESNEYQSRINVILNRKRENNDSQSQSEISAIKKSLEAFATGNKVDKVDLTLFEGDTYHPQASDYENLTGKQLAFERGVSYTNILISICETKIKNAIIKSIKNSLLVSFFIFLVIYLVKVGKKGSEWVSENSKNN